MVLQSHLTYYNIKPYKKQTNYKAITVNKLGKKRNGEGRV